VIDDHQKAVGNRYDSFVLANPARKAVVLGGKLGIFPVREHPDHFCQHGPSRRIALGRLEASPFAPTLLVAWAHKSPRREMLGAREPRHIIANFCQKSREPQGQQCRECS